MKLEEEVVKTMEGARESKDVIFDSIYNNIKEFIQDKNLDKLIGLCEYISTKIMHRRPPNELEKEFITEFFTYEGWAMYVQEQKNPSKLFQRRPPFDMNNILGILNYEVMSMARKKLQEPDRVVETVKDLKVELENALDNAIFDGVFDKVEGFSNLYEVLIRHDMVKERED